MPHQFKTRLAAGEHLYGTMITLPTPSSGSVTGFLTHPSDEALSRCGGMSSSGDVTSPSLTVDFPHIELCNSARDCLPQ